MITKKQREQLIDWLVEDDQYAFSQGHLDDLTQILKNGWSGYDKYCDHELVNEYYERADHDPLNLDL